MTKICFCCLHRTAVWDFKPSLFAPLFADKRSTLFEIICWSGIVSFWAHLMIVWGLLSDLFIWGYSELILINQDQRFLSHITLDDSSIFLHLMRQSLRSKRGQYLIFLESKRHLFASYSFFLRSKRLFLSRSRDFPRRLLLSRILSLVRHFLSNPRPLLLSENEIFSTSTLVIFTELYSIVVSS